LGNIWVMSLYFCGDSHGECGAIVNWSSQVENSTLYHVGDLGIDEFRLDWLAARLNKRNNKLFAIFGNHEHFRFNDQVYGKNENLKLLKDYSIIEIDGKRILGIGGAISLDRQFRKEWAKKHPGKSNYYHEDEFFHLDEKFLNECRNIDILVTHTIPEHHVALADPNFPKKFAQYDDKLMEDLAKERADVQKAFDILSSNNKLQLWCVGHWHISQTSYIGETKVKMLNIDEIYELV
jgi:predicted phosphodiesterase